MLPSDARRKSGNQFLLGELRTVLIKKGIYLFEENTVWSLSVVVSVKTKIKCHIICQVYDSS